MQTGQELIKDARISTYFADLAKRDVERQTASRIVKRLQELYDAGKIQNAQRDSLLRFYQEL